MQSQTSHPDLPTLGSLSSGPGPDMTLEAHRRIGGSGKAWGPDPQPRVFPGLDFPSAVPAL